MLSYGRRGDRARTDRNSRRSMRRRRCIAKWWRKSKLQPGVKKAMAPRQRARGDEWQWRRRCRGRREESVVQKRSHGKSLFFLFFSFFICLNAINCLFVLFFVYFYLFFCFLLCIHIYKKAYKFDDLEIGHKK